MLGSIGCVFPITADFARRMVKGVGGAMMTPVGRLILLRSIDRRAPLSAMAWVTMPALIADGGSAGWRIHHHLCHLALIFIINIRSGSPARFGDAVY